MILDWLRRCEGFSQDPLQSLSVAWPSGQPNYSRPMWSLAKVVSVKESGPGVLYDDPR